MYVYFIVEFFLFFFYKLGARPDSACRGCYLHLLVLSSESCSHIWLDALVVSSVGLLHKMRSSFSLSHFRTVLVFIWFFVRFLKKCIFLRNSRRALCIVQYSHLQDVFTGPKLIWESQTTKAQGRRWKFTFDSVLILYFKFQKHFYFSSFVQQPQNLTKQMWFLQEFFQAF